MQTYLCIIDLAGTEKRIERIISWDQETGEVDKEGAGDIEKDEKEV